MKHIALAALTLSLTGCAGYAGYVKSFSLGVTYGETRVDATWILSGKRVVPTK